MGMELRHLRHFVAVAEELHFARAADRLGMEQSPLSHSIRNLEAELGIRLFHRTTRRTWLTRAGERFYTHARRILADVDSVVGAVRNGDVEEPLRLSLGLAEHAASEPFTRLLFELEHGTPPISVDLREVSRPEAVRLVNANALDLAVVLEPVDEAGLSQVHAWTEPLALLLPIGHPLAENDRGSLADLRSERLVLLSKAASPGYAAQVDALLRRHSLASNDRTIVDHQNTMISLVAAGRGLALLPESIALGLTTVAVLHLADADAGIGCCFIYREDERASEPLAFALSLASGIDRRAYPGSDTERAG